MAVILRQIEMEVGKQTFVRFRLNTSFTRIASSLDKAQSTGGFTRYFRQFKKEVEEAGTGDDYIFIFSHKEYMDNREKLLAARGKVIIIDNTGVTLLSDKAINSEVLRELLRTNQMIVRDFTTDHEKQHTLQETARNIGYLTRIKKRDKDGNLCNEIRLAYRNRIDYQAPVSWLFVDRDMLDYAGMDLVNRDSYREMVWDKETAEPFSESLSEYEVLDVTGWDSLSVQALLEYGRMRIFSDKAEAAGFTGETKLFLADTENLSRVRELEQCDPFTAVSLLHLLKEQNAEQVKFIGPAYLQGKPVEDSEVYGWKQTENGRTEEYFTVVLFPQLRYTTYKLEMLDSVALRFGLRVARIEGMPAVDALALINGMFQTLAAELQARQFMQ